MANNFTMEINELLNAPEGEHYEFKEAKNRYDFEESAKYCCALSNFGGGITYAALILFGTSTALRKYLAQSEIIFEYRSSDASA